MYDERFARQYRYEPPPEFPQALPFTGIVHHLSGPNRYAHAQTSPNWSVGFWCKHLRYHFHYARRFLHPRTCKYVRLLGPCFKTGRIEPCRHHSQVSPLKCLLEWIIYKWVLQGTFTHPEACYHVPRVVLTSTLLMTHLTRHIICSKNETHTTACAGTMNTTCCTQQSYQTILVPSAFLSASSGTFNSLFKVLFIFPSWYLFAIGLELVFSWRWNLPPNLRSNPEERDS